MRVYIRKFKKALHEHIKNKRIKSFVLILEEKLGIRKELVRIDINEVCNIIG